MNVTITTNNNNIIVIIIIIASRLRVKVVDKKYMQIFLAIYMLYMHPETIFRTWITFTYPRQYHRILTFFQNPSICDIPFPLSPKIHGIISGKVNLVWINNTFHYRTRRKELLSKPVFYDWDENADSSREWITSSIYGNFKGGLSYNNAACVLFNCRLRFTSKKEEKLRG